MAFLRRRSTVLLSATILGAAALSFEPAIRTGMDVEIDGARITVGAARTSLWRAAFAQTPSSVVLENVALTVGTGSYKAKRIEFTDVTSSRAEIDALFDASSSEPLPARLGKISARQIVIPELVTEQQAKDVRTTSTYKNIVLTDIRQGKIASITADSAATQSTGGKNPVTITQGRATITSLDAREAARVYLEKAGTTQPLTQIYASFEVGDINVTDGANMDLTIARMSGRDLRARPTKDSWADMGPRMAGLAENEKLSKEQGAQLMSSLADMLGAFDSGLIEITGMVMKDRSGATGGTARIARVAYTGSIGGQPEARIEGFEFSGKDGTARIASIAFTGFSFQPTLEGLKELQGKSLDDIDVATWRKLIPTIGTMRFSGLDFDLPNEDSKAPKPDRIRFGLSDLEITADKPINGIPTNIRLGVQNLSMPLPADTTEEGLKDLVALGYKSIDLSFTTAANWNESSKELLLREVSARGRDIGAVSLRGVFGNVSKDVFEGDTAIAMVALIGATAKSADLTVDNNGLFDRYLAQESTKQKKTPEALRREYGTVAAVGIPAILGNSAQAKSIGQAVARFVAKPGRLSISARSKDPAGLGFMDVMALSDPSSLLTKVDVTATAE